MKSDIRYVCLSDTHFGARSSLLTRFGRGSRKLRDDNPILDALIGCLRAVVRLAHKGRRPPALVLNGDVLELALAETPTALMAFEQFLVKAFKRGDELFSGIVFVPGNHDHHLWETAREEQYARHVAGLASGEVLDAPWHATKVFTRRSERPVQELLTASVKRLGHGSQAATIRTAYPNFGVSDPSGSRCVVFHHGHFIEPLYKLMSVVTRMFFPDEDAVGSIYQLERENFAWIDFLWSTLGRSGAAGSGMRYIYESRNDTRKLKRIMRNLAKVIAREHLHSGLPDWAEERMLRWILYLLVEHFSRRERNRPHAVLSREAAGGLREYIDRFLADQLAAEAAPNTGRPKRLAFVFGHTHKPFTRMMRFAAFDGSSPVLNTGGWVIDVPEATARRGASFVLVDADLNTANVRLFNEGTYTARVERAGFPSSLTDAVTGCMAADETPWKAFAEAVRKGVAARRRKAA